MKKKINSRTSAAGIVRAGGNALRKANLDLHPLRQFDRWFEEARRADVRRPEAMALATSGRGGAPSLRIVLLKELDSRGFVFYTSYESRKAGELDKNRRAALVFHWKEMGRQVRIEGTVRRISRERSRRYFDVRPRASQIAAWASNQSLVIPDRGALLVRFMEIEERFRGRPVPLPPFWGGYVVIPAAIEFWQEGKHRLHDRIRYVKSQRGWKKKRLSP